MTTKRDKEILKGKIRNIGDLPGKIIQDYTSGGSAFYISFTDGTWVELDAVNDWEGCAEIEINNQIKYVRDYQALERLGIVTEEMILEIQDQERKAHDRSIQRKEKKEYERLRQKFERKL